MNWIKSTRCGESTHCVVVAFADDGVHVRDSKNPDGPVLSFTRAEWEAFVAGAKAGEFDLAALDGEGEKTNAEQDQSIELRKHATHKG